MSFPYLNACPIGCNTSLVISSLQMSEGPLLQCTQCGQLMSQCNEKRYWQSMVEFNTTEGTLPKPDAVERRYRRSKKYLKQIEEMLDKPRSEIRLLDVGCSSGYFLSVAGQLGFQAEGVEPAADALQTARAAGLTVHEGLLQDATFPDQSFDAITLFEVVEHVKDALDLFKECRRILRSGGVILIGTANTASWTFSIMKSRWEYFHIEKHGGHVSFFNPRSMQILAKRTGFDIERIETRSLKFCEKDESNAIIYRLSKIFSELAETPSRLLGRGHDMLVFIRKQ
jgi:2-polyprenyl-3-methyl-5-hydroxy-6-metoxy-1,4-benzoquinol methylase